MPIVLSQRASHLEWPLGRLEGATAILTSLAVVAILFSIAVSQILLGAALLSLLLSRRPLEFPNRLRFPLLAFVGWTLLSLAFSSAPLTGLSQVRKLFIFFILVLVYNAYPHHRQIWRTLQGLFLAGTIAAAYGLVQFVRDYYGFQREGLPFYDNYVANQITGFMGHWMTFSGQLMLVLLALASVLLFCPPAKIARWWWLGFSVGALGLLAAFTRGIWLGTLAGIAYLLARSQRRALWLLPLAVVLLYFLSPSWLQQRERSIFDTRTDSSNQSRLTMFYTGLEMIAAHPWFGLGPERVGPEFLRYKPASQSLPPAWYGHLHNDYLQIAAERGLPCLGIWLWLLFEVLRDHLAVARSGALQARALGHAGVAITLGLMVSGLFEFNFGDSEVLMLYLFLISLAYAWERLERQAVSELANPNVAAASLSGSGTASEASQI